jgi:Ca2+-transporting ATPase
LGAKGGCDRHGVEESAPRLAEIPFDSAHRFMATWHRVEDEVHLYIKGAPEVVLEKCDRWESPQGEAPLDEIRRAAILRDNEALAARHLRVLAVAMRRLAPSGFNASQDLFSQVERLTFLGLVGLMDAPRPEAKNAIDVCKQAGIAVKMITGDQPGTASAIAAELGLHGRAVTGAELDRMSAEALAAAIGDITVFARVSPEHKLKIVQALKARGEVVAMTGDGVNDAPALKSAHIGVAMGLAGTEVSKEAATMVLTDDNFASIVRAVRAGRTIYDNIVKFVRFQLSTNVGAIITMLTASLLALPDPFNPIQILWVNIIMDGPPAMALGLEPSRAEIMHDKPRRPGTQILSLERLARIVLLGLIMVAGTLGVLVHLLREAGLEQAITGAFTTFVFFQVFNVFNMRSERGSIISRYFFTNHMFWVSVTLVAALQVVAVEWPPAQTVFHTTALTARQWATVIAVAASILVVEEVRKAIARGLNSRRRP